MVTGDYVPFQFNYMTSTTQRKKLMAQLTMEVLKGSNAPRLTPKTHGHFVKVEFSSDSESDLCYVLYATPDSTCPLLRNIHQSCYDDVGMSLELALDTLERSAWEGDHSAGGKYAAFGIGFMDTRQPKPFFLRNHRFQEQAATITTALSGIFGAVAAAVLNYVPDAFRQNENLKCCNENFSFPPCVKWLLEGWG